MFLYCWASRAAVAGKVESVLSIISFSSTDWPHIRNCVTILCSSILKLERSAKSKHISIANHFWLAKDGWFSHRRIELSALSTIHLVSQLRDTGPSMSSRCDGVE